MKKKSQIRKYTVEKVEELTQIEQIPEMLKMYAEHVSEKKNKLKEKRESLQIELDKIRKRTEKNIEQMIDNVKDRLERKQRVVMDSRSRPTPEDIKNMTELFSYMQNQGKLISVNSSKLMELQEFLEAAQEAKQFPSCSYEILDETFARLQQTCEMEEEKRQKLREQRDKNREFYANIRNTIEQCRKKYEIIEQKIAEREKQLDHLVTYFQTRQRQDKQKVQYENNLTTVLEIELLKAQEIVNFNFTKEEGLKIAQIQFSENQINENKMSI